MPRQRSIETACKRSLSIHPVSPVTAAFALIRPEAHQQRLQSGKAKRSRIEASLLSGLLTRVEIGHIFIRSDG